MDTIIYALDLVTCLTNNAVLATVLAELTYCEVWLLVAQLRHTAA